MKKQSIGMPFAIRLEASATDIFLVDIATAIFNPLRREIREELSRYGTKFSLMLYLQRQWEVRCIDFRYELLNGLIPEPGWDESNSRHIRRTILRAAGMLPQRFREVADKGSYSSKSRAIGEHLLIGRATALAERGVTFSLTENDMYQYVEQTLPDRIWQMLDDDVASGALVVHILNGTEIVYLDHLVAWAVRRKIKIEQEALPGCEPLAAASYQRLHQQLTKKAPPIPREARVATPVSREISPVAEVTSNWKMKVQAEATAMYLRLYEAGANPTIRSIKDDLATYCRKESITTDTGILPTGEYLRSHVLSKKHWTPPPRPKKTVATARTGGASGTSGTTEP